MEANRIASSSYINNAIVRKRYNIFLEKIIKLFFRKLNFDKESLSTLNEFSSKNKIVFISFQSSNTTLQILINLLRRHKLKIPELALGFKPHFFQMILNFFKSALRFVLKKVSSREYEAISDFDFIKNMLNDNKILILSLLSRKLFLRRYLEIKSDSLQYLIEAQKIIDDPIYIFPQILFWNRNPERTKTLITSRATGDRGLFSALFTILKSGTPAFMRISTPINLKKEIANSSADDVKHIARKIRNRLLEVYNQEKRTILGPVIKSQQEMMEKVLYHKNIMDRIRTLIQEDKESEKKLRKMAYKYFKEIAADFSIIALKWFHIACVLMFKKIFDGIYYNIDELKKIREASQRGPLIIVPSHKSHMDYLIISSIFYQNKIIPPHIIAGSNLTFFPMGPIFRKSGAFFMRRSFKDIKLYPEVFKQYIKTLINEGYSIEFFIEGGRTRTGKLVFPKMGILKYLIEAIDEGYNRDMIFLPTTITYDRILEESSYHKELKGKEKKSESTSTFVKSRKLLKRKYGKVYLSFSDPVSYRDLQETLKEEEDLTTSIGNYIIKRIYDITMVTPFAITSAAILLSSHKGFSKDMLKEKILLMYNYLKFVGATVSDTLKSESNIEEIIEYVLESYEEDNIVSKMDTEKVEEKGEIILDGYYILNEEERARINFYKNSIIHFFLPVTFISILIINISDKTDVDEEKIKNGFSDLMELFSREFIYPETMDNKEKLIGKNIKFLEKISAVVSRDGSIAINNEKINELVFYSKMLQDLLESYLIVLDTITLINKKSMNKKELIYEIRKNGIKLYHLGNINTSEALSMSNYENALSKCKNYNILDTKHIDKRNIEVNITDVKKAQEMKGKIEGYLKSIRSN